MMTEAERMEIAPRATAAVKVLGFYFTASGGLGLLGAAAEILRSELHRLGGPGADPTLQVMAYVAPAFKPVVALAVGLFCIRRTDSVLRKLGLKSRSPFDSLP